MLQWLLENPLPGVPEAEWGAAGSERRRGFLIGVITRWRQMYGQRENMGEAVARWSADITFLERLPLS